MGFINRLFHLHLKTLWEYSTDGILWRLINCEDEYFVGEDRNVDSKFVTFFCVEQRSGKVLWNDVGLNEKWWTGIESIHRNILLIHGYATPDMPDHKKIYAFDIKTGKQLWMNEDITFLFSYKGSIYTSKDTYENKLYFVMNPSDGEYIREIDPDEINSIVRKASEEEVDLRKFPNSFDSQSQMSPEFNTITRKAIDSKKNIEMIEYIETPYLYIFTYYEPLDAVLHPSGYRQDIVVVERRMNNVIYRGCMNSNTKALHSETYFSIGDYLYYIKERKILTALHLPSN